MARHADPALLSALKGEWSDYGCILCGRGSAVTAPSGFGVELDHVWSRGQGGGDYRWNIIGLCGELAGCRGHWRKTTNRISIAPSGRKLKESPDGDDWRWVLTDEDGKEVVLGLPEPCKEPPIEAPPGAIVAPGRAGAEPRVLEGDQVRSPGERMHFIRRLWQTSEQQRIAVAVMLGWVDDQKEWRRLGYERISEYAADAGIPKADCSKMLLVSRTFLGRWMELPEVQQSELSLERLYMAARLVRDHDYTLERGLEAAVVHPTDQLVALIKGDEPAHICTCPTCGKRHIQKGSMSDPDVVLDA